MKLISYELVSRSVEIWFTMSEKELVPFLSFVLKSLYFSLLINPFVQSDDMIKSG